uniref:SET domain-containing protein n=1 Tax=Heterorhabditis bacteriophora TaxID=37862 RepID=A0A1I7WH41_HETBA
MLQLSPNKSLLSSRKKEINGEKTLCRTPKSTHSISVENNHVPDRPRHRSPNKSAARTTSDIRIKKYRRVNAMKVSQKACIMLIKRVPRKQLRCIEQSPTNLVVFARNGSKISVPGYFNADFTCNSHNCPNNTLEKA